MLAVVKQFGVRLWHAARGWQQDQGSLLSAAIAYYGALSFFPLLLVLTASLGFFLRFSGRGKDAQSRLLEAVSEQASPELADLVNKVLHEVETQAPINGPVGLATLLFTAVIMFSQLERAFNRVWRLPVPPNRGMLAALGNVVFYRVKAFAVLLIVGALLIAVFISSIVLATIEAYTGDFVLLNTVLSRSLHFGAGVALNVLLFTLLYKIVPRGTVPWSAAARGGLLAAATWEIGRMVLAAFLLGDRYSAYGVIGSFLALMLWMYYGSAVMFLGAEFGKTYVDTDEPPAKANS